MTYGPLPSPAQSSSATVVVEKGSPSGLPFPFVTQVSRPARKVFYAHPEAARRLDRKSTRLNSSHLGISYAVFCLKKKQSYALEHAQHGPSHWAQREECEPDLV